MQQLQQEVLTRLLDTPAARRIAAEIEGEKESKRKEIQDRIDQLLRERKVAVIKAQPVFDEASARHTAALAEVKAAQTAYGVANTALSRAQSLHYPEVCQLRQQLEEIR